MIKRLICLFALIALAQGVMAQNTLVQLLSGSDKDHTVDWQFQVSGGRNSGEWKTIPVPSSWEMQGFGTYRYWSDWDGEPAPDREGKYKHSFFVPADWQGSAIEIVFGGVMTDAEVRVNGELLGPVHRGGFYEFRYPLDKHLHYGQNNLLEVNVSRFSENKSINLAERRADFWMFSGIYRPVWLEVKPAQHIRQVAINASHTGDFQAHLAVDGIDKANRVSAQIIRLDGKRVGPAFSASVKPGQSFVDLHAQIKGVHPWSAEDPQRYKVVFELKAGRKVIHQVEEVFGFRTIELRPRDGLYVNDKKVHLKGVNRHSFWPDSGATTSEAISRQDIELIKAMNMNAVRTAHAPPDRHFLDVADELGVYVLDELTGWQDAYDTEAGRPLVQEMIERDRNHPSVILWANGNEGGWNTSLDADFASLDMQARPVVHPWGVHGGIDASHYETYDCCTSSFFGGPELFMPTEFLHALYDGGGGAGLDDWWNRMLQNPLAIGGFIWSFADEAIVREDQGGALDTAGNSAPDGVLGPYRDKEGSFYAIREIWSPVYFPLAELSRLPSSFNGQLHVENRYDFTNLNQLTFTWELRNFANPSAKGKGHSVVRTGQAKSDSIAPGHSGDLNLKLPEDWYNYDSLALTAKNPQGQLIHTWTWMTLTPEAAAKRALAQVKLKGAVKAEDSPSAIKLQTGDLTVTIDKQSGRLARVVRGDKTVSLSNGPRLVSGKGELEKVSLWQEGDVAVVAAQYKGDMSQVQWRLHPNGWLQINYGYHFPGDFKADYLGITFDYPESQALGITWLGRGPYRVWKNRLKGMTFDIWHTDYNDTITGQSGAYPEFKGFYRDFYWGVLETRELPITLAVNSENTFLRLFTPREPANPAQTHLQFPAGDISILQGIAPIGTKFHRADEMGIQGAANHIGRLGHYYSGELYLYFGELPN